MSENRPKVSSPRGSSSPRKESDEESGTSKDVEVKRRPSLPKIIGSAARRKLSDTKSLLELSPRENGEDYTALLDATDSKHHKKWKLSSTYAEKKQVLQIQNDLLIALAALNEKVDDLCKENVSLTYRVSHLERELVTLQSIQNSQRKYQYVPSALSLHEADEEEEEGIDRRDSSSSCLTNWFL